MNMPMIDVPKEGVSITLDVSYGLHYPRLSLLRCSQLIPVVLRTEDVGQQAYNSMVNDGQLVLVPPGAEGVADFLELLFIKYSIHQACWFLYYLTFVTVTIKVMIQTTRTTCVCCFC
jgi:hypothetical protein